MADPTIPGGYILLSRKIIESEIWSKPPLYLKVWIYLLSAAQHKDYKKLRRGQVRTSIPELIEACSWKIGFRTERPTKDQIYQILSWLREVGEGVHEADTRATVKATTKATTKATMITTMRATHGMLINIDNYCFYQDSKNYESNGESNDESNAEGNAESNDEANTMPDNTNKNEKNVKNDKNVNIKPSSSRNKKPTYSEDDQYYKMAVYLHEKIMSYAALISREHLVRNANLQDWADEFRKIVEIDKRKDKHEIKEIIDWATSDPFWQLNILSAKKLREKYGELGIKMSGAKTSPAGGTGRQSSYSKTKSKLQQMYEEALQD